MNSMLVMSLSMTESFMETRAKRYYDNLFCE